MNFGMQLKTLREQRDMKQTELSAALHMSESTISGYITNHRQPCLETLARIAGELETTTDFLLGLTESPDPPFPLTPTERSILLQYHKIPPHLKRFFLSMLALFASDKNLF